MRIKADLVRTCVPLCLTVMLCLIKSVVTSWESWWTYEGISGTNHYNLCTITTTIQVYKLLHFTPIHNRYINFVAFQTNNMFIYFYLALVWASLPITFSFLVLIACFHINCMLELDSDRTQLNTTEYRVLAANLWQSCCVVQNSANMLAVYYSSYWYCCPIFVCREICLKIAINFY